MLDSSIDDHGTASPRLATHAAAEADAELMRAHRIANDMLEPDDMRWLRKGFNAFLASGGKLPLERCLHLPANERSMRRARRDHWLRTAWDLVDPFASSWRRSEGLATAVHRFQAEKWPRWSALDTAPAYASAVDRALFEACRSGERVPSTAMQLHNIACARRAQPARATELGRAGHRC